MSAKKRELNTGKNYKTKLIVGVIGIVVTILGWAISNAIHIDVVKKIIAPKYDTAIATWKKMTNKSFVLKQGDKGFSELKELFNYGRITLTPEEGSKIPAEWVQIKKLDNWDITQFRTLDSRLSMVDVKLNPVKCITLEIESSNFHPITIPSVHSIDEGIESYFFKNPIFKYGAYIFWFGVAISTVSMLMKTK